MSVIEIFQRAEIMIKKIDFIRKTVWVAYMHKEEPTLTITYCMISTPVTLKGAL